MADKNRVYIVDDDQAMRQSLQFLLESVDLEVRTFDSAEAFLDALDPEAIGCLVVDLRMPGMSGAVLQDQLTDRAPDLPVIMVTGYGTVSTAVKAMRSGAFDFIEKPINDQALLDRVQEALRAAEERRRRRRAIQHYAERLQRLTRREEEVMNLIVDGMSNRQVAEKLGLSEKTVEVHRARIMDKTEARNVVDLVQLVLRFRDYEEEENEDEQNATS